MNFTTRIFTVFILILFLNSCAFHTGVMSGNAALSDANFKVVDYAIGTAETFKVFGLGGVATDAIVLEAKRNLYKNYPLGAGQALANVSVDFQRSFFLIVSKTKVVVSADIIDFNSDVVAKSASDNFPFGGEIQSKEGNGANSEMVYLKYQDKYKLGQIVGYDLNKAKVLVNSDRNRMVIRRVPIRKLYFMKKNDAAVEHNFNIMDEVFYLEDIVDENGRDRRVTRYCKIFAFGTKAALVEYDLEGVPIFFAVEYDKLKLKE